MFRHLTTFLILGQIWTNPNHLEPPHRQNPLHITITSTKAQRRPFWTGTGQLRRATLNLTSKGTHFFFINFVFFRQNTISNFYILSFNDFCDFRSMRGGKSITSGSPMSPGSFVSSESAGSSNSLDETDDNRIVTPIDDHMGPATIFEVGAIEKF